MPSRTNAFGRHASLRGQWRRYIDGLEPHRASLHTYCRRLTGNVWDAEDLVQDTLVRVFGLLGRTDARLENPRAYLIRTATNIWIDRVRRMARESAYLELERSGEPLTEAGAVSAGGADAVRAMLQTLHPQERAAILMKDVFDLSLEETASMLGTTVGAVKAALSRARGRLEHRRPGAGLDVPPRALVEQFMRALAERDLATMRTLCAESMSTELVGGVELMSFEKARSVFQHAHMVMPKLGFGSNPRWEIVEYEGEPLVAGFRTLDGVEGLNEVHRLEAQDGRIMRIRIYCFCPETLAVIAADLGCNALPRPHRSPSLVDAAKAMLGVPQAWRTRQ